MNAISGMTPLDSLSTSIRMSMLEAQSPEVPKIPVQQDTVDIKKEVDKPEKNKKTSVTKVGAMLGALAGLAFMGVTMLSIGRSFKKDNGIGVIKFLENMGDDTTAYLKPLVDKITERGVFKLTKEGIENTVSELGIQKMKKVSINAGIAAGAAISTAICTSLGALCGATMGGIIQVFKKEKSE